MDQTFHPHPVFGESSYPLSIRLQFANVATASGALARSVGALGRRVPIRVALGTAAQGAHNGHPCGSLHAVRLWVGPVHFLDLGATRVVSESLVECWESCPHAEGSIPPLADILAGGHTEVREMGLQGRRLLGECMEAAACFTGGSRGS